MKKRVLALVLALAMMTPLATVFANATPYLPPSNAMKAFGAEHLYFYEVNAGQAAPKMDGLVTESDGYGDPVAVYSMRYITTAEKVIMKEGTLEPRDEYKMVDSGDRSGEYNVFPTADSPEEVWQSISAVETDSPYAFPYYRYYMPTTYSATASYNYYNPTTGSYATAYHVKPETFGNYEVITSRTTNYQVDNWELLTAKPADWETNFTKYFTTVGGAYSKLNPNIALSDATAPVFEPGIYYNSSSSTTPLTTQPADWNFHWKNGYYKARTAAPAWNEGYYYSRSGDATSGYTYTITQTKPADWETNYTNYYSRGQVYWYPLTGTTAPEWEEGKYYSGEAKECYLYSVQNTKCLYTKPADWEKNWKNYYFKLSSTATSYYPIISKSAPEFVPGMYFSGTKLTSKLFLSGEGGTGGLPTITVLRTNHVVLPETVNVYARYDNKYFYSAVEVVEPEHKNVRYDMELRFASTLSASPGVAMNNYSFGCNYRMNLGKAPEIIKQSYARIYFNAATNLSTTGYQMGVLNKYGNPNITTIQEALTRGTWFNVKHYTKAEMDAINGVEATPPQEEEEDDLNSWMIDDTSSTASSDGAVASFNESGTYGTTVYEYKQLWTVINSQYDGTGSAVPEMFYTLTHIQMENALANGTFLFAIEVPRDTRHLLGSLSRTTGGNWPKQVYTMRYINRTGLTTGEGFGKFRFQWAQISSGYNVFNNDYVITDYTGVTQKKTISTSHIEPLWYPSGQEVAGEEYKAPYLDGTQLRADSCDEQALRFFINLPNTDKQVKEAGVLIAPTEASRRTQLRLGMDEIRYNAVDFAKYYGYDLETRKYVNLAEDPATNFAANATPNDADSFITYDAVGGLPSAIYHVQDLKINLDDPYDTAKKYSTYTVEFTGLKDIDGTYNDYFTFYTIRPYVIYEDGTVVYGEHEYRSVYYVACWTIQQIIDTYNTANTLTTASTRYTMDMMAKVAMTNADGTTAKDANGNTLYTDNTTTPNSESAYYGSAEFSFYEASGDARTEVFRSYAVSMFNRANRGYSLRVKDFDNFRDEEKEIITGYMEMFENIWQTIVKCESKVYMVEK